MTDTNGGGDLESAQVAEAEMEANPHTEVESPSAAPASVEQQKWPGWPGDNVFRLIVPVTKVGSIIGRKGEFIKKICEETRAKVRILEGAIGTPERIVLISAREELETALSPAMDAALRVFKRVNDISEDDGPATLCSVKLLIASSQAISLIGKQGASVKSIQDNSGASVRILPKEELPYYATAEERIVDIQGETSKALKALEAVLAHLRKFLVDHSILPLFEKSLVPPAAQDHAKEPWGDKTQSLIRSAQQTGSGKDYSIASNLLHLENRTPIDLPYQRARLSIYGQDPSSAIHTPALGRAAGSLISQITQTMQVPLAYAEEIIGIGGGNISFIRRTSGAVIALEESRTVPDEIVIEIKGNSTQVQTAQQLIEDVVTGHKEPAPRSYGSYDTDYRSSYASLSGSGYLSSPFRGYGSSSVGGYGAYRL
ncbi:RNA-binding KH domain-containing protein PEPPER-like [Curcuma longa]|uniref:RNA-binding KH domain-containing protein PEPPER-like n=1 Tax=Curcuma longa TaxID=136217 RepID=UPI003D9DCFE9